MHKKVWEGDKMSDFLYTTKGYAIEVCCIRQTVMGDVACCVFYDKSKWLKIRKNDKGDYIEVRHQGKYYGRCYLFN
jgi:hypothetical protein